MDELLRILQAHAQRYPQATAVDFVKLVYQHEFGPGHFITDEVASLARLAEEVRQLQPISGIQEELFEPIGGGLVRLHLRALGGALPLTTVNRFFVLTAQKPRGSAEGFRRKLEILREYLQDQSLEPFFEEYRLAGYPPLSHSERYRRHYAPAYRVVKGEFSLYFPVFREIERLLSTRKQVVVAIDGRSGSGKSSLAKLLQDVYGCSTISMDHFFLRPEQRTAARLQEPGGNVDYERFQEEVGVKLRGTQPFHYRIFNCQDGSFTSSPSVNPEGLTVVEGSYSHHPNLQNLYDLKVFLTVPQEVQRDRILQRSGAVLFQRFEKEWIPLEELYFSTLKIEDQSHISINTHS
ncbi:uridine kinase family protein [Candidatus Darwinibacter acetoxidans]|jgi:hypothetical protein